MLVHHKNTKVSSGNNICPSFLPYATFVVCCIKDIENGRIPNHCHAERPTFNIFFHLSLTAASSLLFLNTDVPPITQLEKYAYTTPILRSCFRCVKVSPVFSF